jgi:anti-sigma regulatory factor (Ser/Thr protein kinase)
MARLGASEEEIEAFRLAVSELGANVVMHGSGSGWTVGVRVGQSGCTMDVWGGAAPPDNVVHHPERWAVADPDRPTGRGLGIVRELMDDVTTEVWRDQIRVVCRLATSSKTTGPAAVAATR